MIAISYNTCWYVYNFRLPLIRALKARGLEVAVIAPRDEYTERIVAEGVSFHHIDLDGKGRNPLREAATIAAYVNLYRKLRPELVLQYTIKPNIYGSLAAGLLGIPVVNNITGLGEAFTTGGPTEAIVRFLYRIAFRRVRLVFFQNPNDQALFNLGGMVKPHQGRLLPGSGVDTERFSPLPRGDGPFTFLQIGRLLKAKGAGDFIAAARVLKEKHPEIRFALLGKYVPDDPKSIEPDLFERAVREGVVEHWGHADDVRPLIAQADCVVLPSYYREGVPRSLLEAASMGKPLVAANSIGTREPVRHGKNGFLHVPKDAWDLTEKLRAMIHLRPAERERMGEESRRLVKERFEERIVIDAYVDAVIALRSHRTLTKNNRRLNAPLITT